MPPTVDAPQSAARFGILHRMWYNSLQDEARTQVTMKSIHLDSLVQVYFVSSGTLGDLLPVKALL